jgi:hypothetical protein
MTELGRESIDDLKQAVASLEARVVALESRGGDLSSSGLSEQDEAWQEYQRKYRQWEVENEQWHREHGQVTPPAQREIGPQVVAAQPAMPWSPAPAYSSAPSRPLKPPRQPVTIEDLLSPRVLAWAGGVVLVAGIAFFVSIGIRDGWITPEMQILGALLICFVLTFGGFHLYEKKDQGVAALATFASGIAGFFATLVVMTQTYDFVDPLWLGLIFAGMVAAGGAWAALRWDSEPMAALALLGALFSPVLIDAVSIQSTVWFVLVGYAACSVVCAARGWQQIAVAAVLVAAPGVIGPLLEASTTPVVLAAIAFWLITIVAFFGKELLDPSDENTAASGDLAVVAVGAVSLVTATLVALRLVDIEHELHPAMMWKDVPVDSQLAFWLIGFSVLHFLAAGVSALRRGALTHLELALSACGSAMLIVGLSFALSGLALVISWGVLALLLAAVVQQIDGNGRDWAPGVMVALCASHVLAVEVPMEDLAKDTATFSQAVIWNGVAAIGVTIAASLAWAFVSRNETRVVAVGVAALSVLYLVGFLFEGIVFVLVLCALSAAASLAGRGHGELYEIALPGLPLLVAALHTVFYEAPPQEALSTGIDQLGVAVLALAAVAGAAGLWASVTERDDLRRGLGGLASFTLVYLGSAVIVDMFQPGQGAELSADGNFGVRQKGQTLLSAFWALTALGAIIYGLKNSVKEVRYAGLALLGIALGKIVLFDLTTLDATYRTGSFIAVGVILLAAAYAYQNLKERVGT